MAHFARINGLTHKVIKVTVSDQEWVDNQTDYDFWVQTSYNTRGGVHYQADGVTPSTDQSKALRKNFAGVGYTYDTVRDAFIPPKAHDSFVLNETKCVYEPPLAYPTDGLAYRWNETDYQADNTTGWEIDPTAK
jgi:hypothetical protein